MTATVNPKEPTMDLTSIRALRPVDETPAALAAAIEAARQKHAEATAEARRLSDALPGLLLGDASEAQIAKAERAATSATATADMINRLLPDLEARLTAARNHDAGSRLAQLRAEAEAASTTAAAEWGAAYPEAAGRIVELLEQVQSADALARGYANALAAAIERGEVDAADVPTVTFATANLFGGGRIGDLVQLPATDGRLWTGAFWFPTDLLRQTWRERREQTERQHAETAARAELERARQAELDARLAAMSPAERKAQGLGHWRAA